MRPSNDFFFRLDVVDVDGFPDIDRHAEYIPKKLKLSLFTVLLLVLFKILVLSMLDGKCLTLIYFEKRFQIVMKKSHCP